MSFSLIKLVYFFSFFSLTNFLSFFFLGTLTEGKPQIEDFINISYYSDSELIESIASLESFSEHSKNTNPVFFFFP